MCLYLEIPASSYHAWRKRGKSKRELENEIIAEEIKKIHKDKKKETYGAVNLKAELLEKKEIKASVNRIRRIMKKNDIKPVVRRKKYRHPKDTKSNQPVADNIINRDFTAEKENEKHVSDITYIPTRQGWLYLCIILDLYSRRVVGWAMDKNMKTGLVLSALDMAIKLRGITKGLIFHSDRGSQYRSNDFVKRLKKLEFVQSMSRKGNCWDNACAESFFKTLKSDLFYERSIMDYEEAKTCIFEYIEVTYNRERRHSAIGYMSPVEFEKKGAKCA
jgi:transposase InsO family protein